MREGSSLARTRITENPVDAARSSASFDHYRRLPPQAAWLPASLHAPESVIVPSRGNTESRPRASTNSAPSSAEYANSSAGSG